MARAKNLPKETRRLIAETARNQSIPLREIGRRFGVTMSTVQKIMAEYGAPPRGAPNKAARLNTITPGAKRREGGIIADDAQWRARSHRIGGC